MRFNDGFWLLKNGVKAFYGLQATSIEQTDSAYQLVIATRPIRHRGDTLGGPVINVSVYSPSQGIIGVRLHHFPIYHPSPDIPLFPDQPPIPEAILSKSTLQDGVHQYSLSTAGLTAVITENPYSITFKSPHRTLTFAGPKHQALFDVPSRWTLASASNSSCLAQDPLSNPHPVSTPPTVRYIHSELNLSPGELIYGLGEQFGPFVKNGQSVKIWNQDGGTSSEQAYKCVPFYITNRGYGIFVNHPGEVEFEIASEKVSRVGVSVADEGLEYFIIYGESPMQILERYTRMTGRPALLPSWTFGLWLSTSFLTSYSSETVSNFLEGMQNRKCNVRVFHIDCFWMKQYEWCSFTFDPENFPDAKKYITEIKEKYGVKICLWINPYVSQLSPIFQEGVEGGYFIKRTNGTPWQWDLWQPGLAIVDFTNPAACEWYTTKLRALMDLGIDTFKTDFGERIPHTGISYHDGSDPMRMHNMYSILYNKVVFDVIRDRLGPGEAVVFARSSFAGGQRFPVHWGGDCESTWEAMAEALRGCLSLTSSGFAFASHDIGGFEGHPPSDIYQRWTAFGLFSSHSRLHGSGTYRVPWNYGEEAAQTMAKLVDAKHRLMPYLYELAIQAHIQGHPMQRAMFLEFLDDRTTHYLDRQYMLGPYVLVAPVLQSSGEDSEYYLPAGRWTYFWSSGRRHVDGPVWIKERVPIDEIPVWIRQGSLLCLGPTGIGRPDYDFSENIEVHVYHILENEALEQDVPSSTGTTPKAKLQAKRGNGTVSLEVMEGKCTVAVLKIIDSNISITKIQGGKLRKAETVGIVEIEVDVGASRVVCMID